MRSQTPRQLLPRFYIGLMAGLLGSSSVHAGALYPVNTVVEVRWGNPLFPSGSVDQRGMAVPGTTLKTYRTGIFGLEYDVNADPAVDYLPFEALCVDANQGLFTSGTQLYYIQTLASYGPGDGINPHNSWAPGLDVNRKKLLGQLFTIGWDNAMAATPLQPRDSAAIQWAAWEIGRETSTTLSLSNGGVYTTGTNTTVRDRANEYLTFLKANPNTPVTDLLIWSPVRYVNGQLERIAGQEMLTLAPTPEPVHVVIPLAGLLAFVIRRRAVRNS